MSSGITYVDHHLASNNYYRLLELIDQTLGTELSHLRKREKSRFFFVVPFPTFDIDALASEVATALADSGDYPFEKSEGTTYATAYMPELAVREQFSNQLQGILSKLRLCMEESLKNCKNAKVQSDVKKWQEEGTILLRSYMLQWVKKLDEVATQTASNSSSTNMKGIAYRDFRSQRDIFKKRLHVSTAKERNEPWLKGHRLTLQVRDISTFNEQISQSILTCLKRANEQEQTIEQEEFEMVSDILEEMKEKPSSDMGQLREAVINQAVPRILREAKVQYLRYLHEGMKEWNKSGKEEGMMLLHNLFVRLEQLDTYTRQIAKQSPRDYRITIEDEEFQLRDLSARADIFDQLPVITETEGWLGESTDVHQGTKTFVMGLKLKLNGPVQAHGGDGKDVLEYNLALLDPRNPTYQQRLASAQSKFRFYEKILRLAFLYSILIRLHDAHFDPVNYFEKQLLPVLRGEDNDQKIAVLQQLGRDIRESGTEKHVQRLCFWLKEFIEHPSIGPKHSGVSRVLSVKDSILNEDLDSIINSNIFFKDIDLKKQEQSVLKHIALEAATTSDDAVCKIPLHMDFDPLFYYPADDTFEKYKMGYDAKDLHVLPIILAPVDKPQERKRKEPQQKKGARVNDQPYLDKYKPTFEHFHRITLYYRHHDEMIPDREDAFVYRFTYQLLSYLFVKMLATFLIGRENHSLFLPIICLHADDDTYDEQNAKLDTETFLHSMIKVLEFLLNQDYLSSSQGFNLNTVEGQGEGVTYLQRNALYSLYNPLPRLFKFPERDGTNPPYTLKKLAVIVVSTRKCDANKKTPKDFLSTIYGEVIGIERCNDGNVRLQLLSTFSGNQDNRSTYERPDVIIEQVKHYHKQGFNHFLYLAHAPYTRNLNVSGTMDLFFMSEPIIKELRSIADDIRIYPVFCDKYYVLKRKLKVSPKIEQPKNVEEEDIQSLYVDDIGELTTVSRDTSRKALIFFNLFNGATVNKNVVYNGVMSYSTLINVYQNDVTYDQYIWNDLLSPSVPGTLRADILEMLTLLHFWRNEKARDKHFKLDPYNNIIGADPVGKLALYPNMNGKITFNSLAFLTEVRAVLRRRKGPKEKA